MALLRINVNENADANVIVMSATGLDIDLDAGSEAVFFTLFPSKNRPGGSHTRRRGVGTNDPGVVLTLYTRLFSWIM